MIFWVYLFCAGCVQPSQRSKMKVWGKSLGFGVYSECPERDRGAKRAKMFYFNT